MGDTRIPETVPGGSDDSSARTTVDPDRRDVRPERAGAEDVRPSFEDGAAPLQRTSRILRRELPETIRDPVNGPEGRRCEAARRGHAAA